MKNQIPDLLSISEIIEYNCVNIVTHWTQVQTVKTVFEAKKISAKKFIDNYGIAILEYFIAVIRKEKELGNCPVMSKLINYMLSKGITPREVFDICMGLRKTLINFILKQDIVLKNPSPFLQELSNMFDANLSGVLDVFTVRYELNQKKLETIKMQKKNLQKILKIINFINTKILIVQNGRIILANKPFLDMLGVKNLKELYLKYEDVFEFLSEVDLYTNEYNNSVSKWIEMVCEEGKSFKCEIYNVEKKTKFIYSGRITIMPDQKPYQYIIALNNISEHIRDEKFLHDRLTHDELTGFRNYPTFEHLVVKLIEEAKKENSRLFLAIVDIPDLREINHHQGMECGDMVISEVAEDLRFLVNNKIYLSRLEGSRFGVLMRYPSEQESYNWCVELLKKMKQRQEKKTIAITEVDLSESVNKLFLRVYDLIEKANSTEDSFVATDFKNIIEYKELPEQQRFIDRLSKINFLKMAIFHMELPITHEVKIISTDAYSIKVILSSRQIKIAKVGMPIYFNLEYIGNIKAKIKDIDVDARSAIIDSFRFDKHSPLNRKKYRIKADDGIKAYITDNDRDYDVKVLDMNSDYVAIEIDRKRNLDINSFIYLDMMLSISGTLKQCNTNATITRIEKTYNGYKMVLLCHLDSDNKNILETYISKQQIEIIHNFQI
jgi:diguanylate cyclase (GGDEF)-like protein